MQNETKPCNMQAAEHLQYMTLVHDVRLLNIMQTFSTEQNQQNQYLLPKKRCKSDLIRCKFSEDDLPRQVIQMLCTDVGFKYSLFSFVTVHMELIDILAVDLSVCYDCLSVSQ